MPGGGGCSGGGGFVFLSSFNVSNVSFLHSDRIVLEDEFRDTWLCGKIWKRRWSNQSIQGLCLQSSLEAQHAHSLPLLWWNIPVLQEAKFINTITLLTLVL